MKTMINVLGIALMLFVLLTMLYAIAGDIPAGFTILLGILAVVGIVLNVFVDVKISKK